MLERVIIDFKNGFGEMQIIENDLLVRYRIEVSHDRQLATITQSKFQKVEDVLASNGEMLSGYVNIGNIGESTTFEQIKNDTSRTEMFRWFAHGVYGIPIGV